LKVALLTSQENPLFGYYFQALQNEGVSIAGVIVDSAQPKKRDLEIHEERTGGKMPSIPFKTLMQQGVPFWSVENHNNQETLDIVRTQGIEALVNAGTPRVLKKPLFDALSLGVINCHPGLLPEFRGCTCVEWAIYLDEPVGNTVHLMVEGIDAGPILLREALSFKKTDSYSDVRVKVYHANCALVARAVKNLSSGIFTIDDFKPQSEGRYFGVIESEKMKEVTRKLDRGTYRYQNES